MPWTRDPASFKDPAGFVFTQDGILYRQVNAGPGDAYRRFVDCGLYAGLVQDGLIVEHDEVALRLPDAPPALAVLRPQRLPFISYPYEWCFSQLKAAALLTLAIQRRALAHDMVLRDASAYNVQFVGGRAILIDTLSFGSYAEGRPWAAYRQFCQHFLAPLALMALAEPSLGGLAQVHNDGIPLSVASALLPASSRFRPGLLMHIHLHGRSGRGVAASSAPAVPTSKTMTRKGMLGLIDSLERTVSGLVWAPPETLWSTYGAHSNYSKTAQEHKRRLVAGMLDAVAARARPSIIWDLGANTGEYSFMASSHAPVVSLDRDPVVVEQHFNRVRTSDNVLPLVQDLLNPSPPVGWNHGERRSLVERGPADCALALALVHHLAIAGNIPLDSIGAFFSRICRSLVVEFVPKEDSQVQRMLALRGDMFHDYSREGFERAFESRFTIARSAEIEGTARRIYLMDTR